jgi:hypothetical protein
MLTIKQRQRQQNHKAADSRKNPRPCWLKWPYRRLRYPGDYFQGVGSTHTCRNQRDAWLCPGDSVLVAIRFLEAQNEVRNILDVLWLFPDADQLHAALPKAMLLVTSDEVLLKKEKQRFVLPQHLSRLEMPSQLSAELVQEGATTLCP